jgi:hypothetical protein
MKIVKKYAPELVFLFLFLILAPVAKNITYMQNDEWIFYDNVRRLIAHNFQLNPLTAPTFYAQDILAYVVQFVAGFQAIPVLTLAISIATLYVLYRILVDRYGINTKVAFVLTAYLLVNPLFTYSMWGFMTENYFLFFFLLTYYFLSDSENRKSLVFGVLSFLLAYMVRQLALVLPVSFALYYLLQKKRRRSMALFAVFGWTILFHFYSLPKTPEMFENQFHFANMTYFRYIFSLAYILGIYIAAFSLPLIAQFISTLNLKNNKMFLFLLIAPVAIILANLYFKPSIVRNEHFYYLINVVQRNGYFTENLHGAKPKFMDYQFFYTAWDLLSKIGAVLVALVIIIKKKTLNINLILIGMYSFLLLISPKLHDRYVLPLFALSILFLCTNIKFNKIFSVITGLYLVLMGFYTYNYASDYIVTNKYVWDKSVELVTSGVNPKNIVSTLAWNFNYDEMHGTNQYKFTYDGPSTQNYATDYTLLNVYEVKYPFRIWRNTKIYLYKKIG